ncbi:biotin--[acetyl-CoA-carboxylase] ligase [Lacrimispora saccharolytica]|uniref:biotin--[acetyl-CoA-carboxylase] ligase n=1 Tax=Lacrimispora saccharolytica TaxID=84030 RepID=UPI0005A12B21|nr:biotin--[acetyl-CoA-carboxylase] ligase [Lacrimispora saccharolytica]QRV21972.1 biotin--[acetyl-CoA-carboxylase] ligase [Lacrimispora saccharolytica]
MKTEILKLLKESDGYLSGQELCNRFGVSRTAVWKAIRQLGEEGYEIEAVRNKGYHFIGSCDIMTKTEIESCIKGKFGREVEYHEIIDSTNIRAKRLAEEGASSGTLVLADLQEAGRGRRGRTWVSPSGNNIFMSLILRPDILPSSASMITLVAALAVYDGIKNLTGLAAGIKWPNDIVANGKKLCGILTEMSAELEGIHYVVVGIGINVNMEEFPEEVRQTATSLFLETGEKVGRSRLVAAVMEAFEQYYEEFISQGDLSGLISVYNKNMVNAGKEVRVLDRSGDYIGKALGINEKGELLVEVEPGKVRRVISGEVSVRGIYGYV